MTHRLLFVLVAAGFLAGAMTACSDDGNSNTPNQDDGSETLSGTCGDGVVDDGESCDDGNLNGTTDHCNLQCNGTVSSYCGDGKVEGWEQCDDGNDDPADGCSHCLKREPYSGALLDLPEEGDWAWYTDPGAHCRDGSQAGFSINMGSDPSKVMFYFEGGGACFEPFNCTSNPPNVASGGGHHPPASGIFDRSKDENPFQDWTFVYFPYCSGDVFAGDAPDATIEGTKGTEFVGNQNMKLFMNRIVPTMNDLTDVQHTASVGMSAGGISATVNAYRIARAFPAARVTVLNDSGPPLPKSLARPCMQDAWRTLWNLDQTVLLDCGWYCPNPQNFLMPMARGLVMDNDRIDFGYFGFNGDATVRLLFFFGANACSEYNLSNLPAVTPSDLQAGLHTLRDFLEDASPRVAFYLAPGIKKHTCVPNSDCFYNMNVDGTSLPDWTSDLLNRTFTDVGD